MHDGIGGGWTMNVLSNGDGMTMSGLWKISETKGIYIKKNNNGCHESAFYFIINEVI